MSAAAAARSGPPKLSPPREGRSPLRERGRQEESTRSSPARELIPKVRIINRVADPETYYFW
jgi:hypothetical protein